MRTSSLIRDFDCPVPRARYGLGTGQFPRVRAHHGEAVGRLYSVRRLRSKLSKTMTARSGFQLVCANCDALAIVLDYAEGAPLSTPINCRCCGARRGTLGDLRNLTLPDERDTSDI